MIRFFESAIDAWDEFRWELEQAIDVDSETVLTIAQVRAVGKGSGVPVEAQGATVWSLRDGKVISAKLFQSKEEAVAAIGLAEER